MCYNHLEGVDLNMWNGKVTDELKKLFAQYLKEFGEEPDEYDELCYEAMTYEEFVGFIKEALDRHCCIVDVVWKDYD